MATMPVLNWKKEQVGEVDLPGGVFDYPYRRHLVWEVVKAHLRGRAPRDPQDQGPLRGLRLAARSHSSRRERVARARAAAARRSTATAARPSVRCRARTRRTFRSAKKKNALSARARRAGAAARSGSLVVDKPGAREPQDAGLRRRPCEGSGSKARRSSSTPRQRELRPRRRATSGVEARRRLGVNAYDVLERTDGRRCPRQALSRVVEILGEQVMERST